MDPLRLLASYVLGYGVVAVLGSLEKLVIESFSDVVYGLHWLTTMPLIALVFAVVIDRRRGPRAPSRKAGTTSILV